MRQLSLILGAIFGMLLGAEHAVAEPFDPMGKVSQGLAELSNLTGNHLFISGYFNAHYMKHNGVQRLVGRDLNEPIFQVREASLFFDVVPYDFLTFSGEAEFSFEFSNPVASGREPGAYAHVNFFYADLDVNALTEIDSDGVGQINVQFGRILVPFLGYNGDKANFRQSLMSQPFTAWQISPVNNVAISAEHIGWTDVGVNLNWKRQIGEIALVDVNFALVNGLHSDEVGFDTNTVQLDTGGMMNPTVVPRDGFFDNRARDWFFSDDSNDDKAIVAQINFRPMTAPVEIGLSFYSGKWDAIGDNNISMFGFHTQYLGKRFNIKGEYAHARVEEEPGLLITPAMGPTALNTTTGDYNAVAWYIEAGAKVIQYGANHDQYLSLIGRYDAVDTNDRVVFTPFDRSRYTIGIEWEFLNQLRLRYEYQRSRLHDFGNAPPPFIAAGGQEHIEMNMISIIGYF